MKSAWLINFKNGNQVILSEKSYLKYEKETPKEDVRSEEHWFDMEKCIVENQDLDLIE